MRDLINYFEGLDEKIYISDMETNELVFMNRRLRESLGYSETDTYKGEKCYKVLQSKNSPCIFCNNKTLEPGKFVTWAHENPILDQRFVIKDTVIIRDGQKYRVEMATEMNKSGMEKAENYFTRREAILNECLQLFFETLDPDKALDQLLKYLGTLFQGDRARIFEIYKDNTITNTYEWCAEGTKPQIDILRNLPLSDISYWMQTFEQGETVEIENIEDICKAYPATYSLLKPQGIESLVVGAISENGSIKGFMGIANPAAETIPLLSQVMKELGKYMVPQLKRRDLYLRFNKMSYYDRLTGAYNYNAMFEHNMLADSWKSVGVICCEINNLKETNDTQGHKAGNALLKECYQILKTVLHTERIYRVSGEEFLALYYNTSEDDIKRDIEGLRLSFMQSICQVSISYAWSDQLPVNAEQILEWVDEQRNGEKEPCSWYDNKANALPFTTEARMPDYHDKLQQFISNNYCDLSYLLTVLGSDNSTSYYFFGDIQKNLFFLSENMRKKFGFENNVVSNLINRWAARIVDANLLKIFWDDINALFEKKKSCHDMRYQIADRNGNNIWIRCFAKIKWNEDGTKPLFLVGTITHQEEEFVVDALTNFPTEIVLMKDLQDIQESDQCCKVIGFTFHNITQINNSHGRCYGDNLIRRIVKKLNSELADKLSFYRLNGMRFLALMREHVEEDVYDMISQIRTIIDESYQEQGVALKSTCSFALMNYPQVHVSLQDFIENMISLIKVARQSPKKLYVDDSAGNIEEIQKISSMERCLIDNLLKGMENFRIVIQPVVSTEDGRPMGGETLLRWRFRGEEVSPGVFIPILEKEHMIQLAGRWVFEQATYSCRRILSYDPDFYLTVNVSLQQLEDEGFVDFIRQTLLKYGLDGRHIVIELTESCMDHQPEKLEQFIKACVDMNMRIALDDFGSGYSSLRVLLQYPSSIIKLDRSLLLEMSDSFEKNAFVTTIVYACHQFGKKVCMEGVETEFQQEIVKEAECDLIQGFYYYGPMELEQVYQLVAER